MHFGLFCLMTQRKQDKTPREIYRETVEHVRLAEQAGFEIAWFAEHHFSSYCLCPSPLAMTMYMAGQTTRIKLGPAVVVVPLYEPIRLAEEIGMADQLSEGRLVLGLGTGYQEYEFHKFGRDLKQGRLMFLEVLDFLHEYLTKPVVNFQREHINMPETVFSVRPTQAKVPVYVAGLASDAEVQGRAMARGYTPFFTTGWNPVETIQSMRSAVASAWQNAGGDAETIPFAIQRYVFVTDSKEEALRAADGARYIRRIAMAMRNNYGVVEGAYIKEIPAADEPALEEIARRLPVGDPETVAERLARDIEAVNPTHISCFMTIAGLNQQQLLRSMERFGSEVIPLLERRFGNLAELGRGVKPRGPAEPASARRALAAGPKTAEG